MASLLIFFRFYLLPYYCHWECSLFFNLQSSNQLNNPPQFLNSITCILVIFHQKTHQVHTCFLSLFLAFSFVIMNKNVEYQQIYSKYNWWGKNTFTLLSNKQDSICKNFIRYAQDGYNGERLKPKTN